MSNLSSSKSGKKHVLVIRFKPGESYSSFRTIPYNRIDAISKISLRGFTIVLPPALFTPDTVSISANPPFFRSMLEYNGLSADSFPLILTDYVKTDLGNIRFSRYFNGDGIPIKSFSFNNGVYIDNLNFSFLVDPSLGFPISPNPFFTNSVAVAENSCIIFEIETYDTKRLDITQPIFNDSPVAYGNTFP